MPLYDFACDNCGAAFEERTAASAEAPACPECGSLETRRVVTGFSGPFTRRPMGGDARRVDAVRAAKEEARLERKEKRREQRTKG